MKRVLFVDDDPRILDGLRRMLRGMRKEWNMDFLSSGREALDAMAKEPFDIVVSDIKMPGMDGAELLTRVQALHPASVRIILSGHSEKELVMKSVGPTHQYLSKPCDPAILKSTIGRVYALRSLLSSDTLKALVSNMETLPSLPSLYQELVDILQQPSASLPEVGQVIARDLGMNAKILQMVNSAYFGLRQPINSIERAVTYLGLETVSSLVLGAHIFSECEATELPGFSLESLWQHSLRTAVFARTVAQQMNMDKITVDDTFIAGMLHDVGKLVLATNLPDRYREVLERVAHQGAPVTETEREVLGGSHGEVGAYLIGLWGLPCRWWLKGAPVGVRRHRS